MKHHHSPRLRALLVKTRWPIILAAFLSVPFLVYAAGVALSDRNNDVRQWLPGGLQETVNYDWFLEHFGTEEFVVASWPGATLEDARVADFAERLSEQSHSSTGRHLIREVVTADDLVHRLQSGRLNLTGDEARARLQGTLVGGDLQTVGVLVKLSDAGTQDRHAVVASVRSAAASVGINADDLRLGGPTVDSVALDIQSEQSRHLLAGISLLLASLAAWRCLRSFTLVAVVLLTSILCAAAALAWVAVIGDQMNMIMVTMPTLVFVLAVSGSIHITHYFQAALRDGDRDSAMANAVAVGWMPCVLTGVTTAIGLGSLAFSHVLPVQLFGFYSALGVLTSLPVVMLVVPALLSLIAGHGREEWHSVVATVSKTGISRMNAVVKDHFRPIVGLGAVVMLIAGVGLTHLSTSVRIVDFFSPESKVIQDYRWLEENIGPLVPVEVVLSIPEDSSLRMTNRVDLVRRVESAVRTLDEVDGVMSAAVWVPKPERRGMARFAERAAMERKLRQSKSDLEAAGYVAEGEAAELWRISARVPALSDMDYGLFVNELKDVVEPVLAEHAATRVHDASPVEATYTGMIPLVYRAQRVLLEDLTTSFISAFALIGVVMLFLMRGIGAGLVSMIPNTFPAIVVFGLMGWSGVRMDIGSMITASVALGIAVDDTIHFMNWFRRGIQAGLSRTDAVGLAYERCAKAMIQTTTICGLGMLAFAFSSFGPTSGFAMLMCTLLVTALIGDLVFLPALLISPVGRLFEGTLRAKAEQKQSFGPRALVPDSAAA